MLDNIWKEVQESVDTYPIIPEGEYNAVIQGYEFDEVGENASPIARVMLVFQNNPAAMLSDNSAPIDGQTAEYTIWFPREEDKQTPARYGRGTMFDVAVRRLKAFFQACGVDPKQYNSMEEAFEACKNARVVVSVGNRSLDDGSLTDFIKKVS